MRRGGGITRKGRRGLHIHNTYRFVRDLSGRLCTKASSLQCSQHAQVRLPIMNVQAARHECATSREWYQTESRSILTSNGHGLQLHNFGYSFLILQHQHRLHKQDNSN